MLTRLTFGSLPLILVAGLGAADEKKAYPNPNLLIEPADVLKLKEDNTRILDARSEKDFADNRVPGAVWVNHAQWSKAFAQDQGTDTKGWSKRIGSLEITPDTLVVVYDDAMNKDAARVWWVLRYWGVKDVRLVNGGWKGYVKSGAKVEGGPPRGVLPAEVTLTGAGSRLADKKSLLDNIKAPPFQIVDARTKEEFCGDAKGDNKKGGAIPGAKHLDWVDLIDKKTGRFKTADELTKVFADAGIDPKKPAVTYCQSGGRASVMAFGLELMGNKDVRNYYRSWAEWGNSDDTPIDKKK